MSPQTGVRWALALHGGAGVEPDRTYDRAEARLGELVLEGETRLRRGDAALDVVVDLVAALESSGLFVAGRGSAPNALGQVELDASVMDGATGRCGAVAAMQGVTSAVRAAHRVMTASRHVLLVGDGASRFALEQGLEPTPDLDDWLLQPDGYQPSDPNQSHGTVGAVALDIAGRLAAATSTGGTYNALPGRVGDSAVIGAGTWADKRVAVSCTGEGEAFIRACVAHDLAARVANGACPADAAAKVLARIAADGADGGLILVTADGAIETAFNSPGMKRALASSSQPALVGAIGGAVRPVRRSTSKGETT
jgi:beta-aspartyl-peptidase (threonine type)